MPTAAKLCCQLLRNHAHYYFQVIIKGLKKRKKRKERKKHLRIHSFVAFVGTKQTDDVMVSFTPHLVIFEVLLNFPSGLRIS